MDLPAEIKRREDRLKVIAAAKARLEQRQRQADEARGRSEGDERRPRDQDGKPKGGRYKRDFGVPEAAAQESFTDSDSRIMKRAGGGFDQSYNAQTALDEQAHIIVAAEVTNVAADSAQLPVMLDAIKANLDALPEQALADAGYRSEAVFEQLSLSPVELVVALGREGKQQCTSMPSVTRARPACATSCSVRRASGPIADASGLSSHPTAGSRPCWGSGNSACGGWRRYKPSSSSCAWR